MPRGIDTSRDPRRDLTREGIERHMAALQQQAEVRTQASEYNRLKAKWHSGENLTAEESSTPMGQQLRRDIYGSD